MAKNISREDPPGPTEINHQVTQVSKYATTAELVWTLRFDCCKYPVFADFSGKERALK
jgi:hypothetical protein